RDATATSVLATWTSGPVVDTTTWRRIAIVFQPPVGARVARIRLIAQRRTGSSNDGYFDAIALRPVGIPTVAAGAVSLAEGTGGVTTASVPVTFHCPGAPVEVTFATADGTAVAGADYVPTSGAVTLDATTSAVAIPIEIAADALDEL